MKNNLKTKVMLAVLAGGMLCANGAWAYWYGTTTGFIAAVPTSAATEINLTIYDTTTSIDNPPVPLANAGTIYGRYGSGSAAVTGSSITFSTSATTTINAGIYGGYSGGSGWVTGNTVIISNGTFKANIIGGYSSGLVGGDPSKDANKVIITGGTFNGSSICIYGGRSGSGNATGNIVTISGGTFNANSSIYGGRSENVSATNNIVTISGGTFENGFKLYGGSVMSGKFSSGNTLNLNTVIGGKADEVKYFQKMNFTIPKGMDTEMPMLKVGTPVALSGVTVGIEPNGLSLSTGDYITLIKNVDDDDFVLTDNLAILDFTSYKELVYGNYALAKGDYTIKQGDKKWSAPAVNGTYSSSRIDGNADNPGGSGLSNTSYSDNEIIVRRGTYENHIVGANSSSDEVKNNKVSIYDGTFSGMFIYGGKSGSANATNNSVIINDGTFNGCIYGGVGKNASGNEVIINGGTINKSVYGGEAVGGEATNNIVTINGGTFANDIALFGGNLQSGSGISTGNTLNLKKKLENNSTSVKFASVQNFQVFNFTLPTDIKAGDVMLSAHQLFVKNSNAAEVNVYAANGVKLSKDDTITLVDVYANVGGGKSDPGIVDGTFEGKDVLGGAGKIELVNDDLILTMLQDFVGPYSPKEGSGADQQKAPVEGVAAAAAMVNVSADLASGEGMDSMLAETAGGETNTFGAVSAGRSKFKTGSHVDVDGWGVVVGAGKTKEWTNGSATTMGIFLEYGKGDFDTYNGVFHGDGDTKNHGVGVMARHKTANNNYYEGNIRYGRQETSWGQSEIGGYETDSRYYGVMVGMGHIIQLGKNELDVYGRYSYGHVGACNAKVGDNDYRFDSVKSHRVRVGGKYNFVRANSKAKPFVGVAWEHEFNGESKATIAGVGQAPAPGLKGNTGIIQAGCDWDLGKKWTAGAGVNAYVGKRKGWDGMLRAFYSF